YTNGRQGTGTGLDGNYEETPLIYQRRYHTVVDALLCIAILMIIYSCKRLHSLKTNFGIVIAMKLLEVSSLLCYRLDYMLYCLKEVPVILILSARLYKLANTCIQPTISAIILYNLREKVSSERRTRYLVGVSIGSAIAALLASVSELAYSDGIPDDNA
ncbi:hypothetical protein PMAYCL1PPCAC_25959, partial [Pristionchus mayeri]